MSEGSQIEYFEKTPFKEPLITEDRGGDIITSLKSDPERIVRIQDDPSYENSTGSQLVEVIKHGASLYKTLSDEFGISVVKHSHVIGHNVVPDSETEGHLVYTVAERIHGVPLDHVDISQVDRDQFIAQVSSLYENLTRYLFTTYKRGEESIGDITSAQQYMYGRRKGETEDKIYLVDVGSISGGNSNTGLTLPEIFELAHSLTDLESKLVINLTEVKEKLKTEIEDLPIDSNFTSARLEARERALGLL